MVVGAPPDSTGGKKVIASLATWPFESVSSNALRGHSEAFTGRYRYYGGIRYVFSKKRK